MSTVPASTTPAVARARRLSDPLLATAAIVLAIAAIVAAIAMMSWINARRAPRAAYVRDQALEAGEQAVLNFNTLDYRHVAAGMSLWERSSTGALRAQVVSGQAGLEKQIARSRTITTARVLDAALTRLNMTAGTATIIVAIQITVTTAHGQAATRQRRLKGSLTRTPAGWKLSVLTQAPAGDRT
ncbi:MAG TPA: hypothetical protein VFQ44_11030 [Streptosporangiaceae bacterium]|nr:hypothetical protein [Streptosporangiaceae bacterium]